MAVLCREFDISRETGYKIFSRYKDCGLQGPGGSIASPLSTGQSTALSGQKHIVQLKKEHPICGAPKIRDKLRRLHSEISLLAIGVTHVTGMDQSKLAHPTIAPLNTFADTLGSLREWEPYLTQIGIAECLPNKAEEALATTG